MSSTAAADFDHLKEWIGRTESAEVITGADPVDGMNATLDRDDPPAAQGSDIPPGWQMLFFKEAIKLADTGPDGHPAKGGFLPPVPLERRMWAGNRTIFHQPMHVGEKLERLSTVAEITLKRGKSGPLVFVLVRHDITGPNGPVLTEEHDVVYRDAPLPGDAAPASRPAPDNPVWRRVIHPTPVLLFRFSALAMVSHRIHYDRDYTTKVEGYPGLLVHGPLTAILLLDLFRREMPDAILKSVTIRALSPLFDIADFTVEGAPGPEDGTANLWARGPDGALAMQAKVTFEH